jgi:hypothetical protein
MSWKLAKHTHTHTKQNKTNFLPGPACPESKQQEQQECSPPGEESDRILFLFTKLRIICCGNISANWNFFFFPFRLWKMILEGNSKPTKRCLRRCLCPRRPILGFQGGQNCLPPPPNSLQKSPANKGFLSFLWFYFFLWTCDSKGTYFSLKNFKKKSLVLLLSPKTHLNGHIIKPQN